MRFFNPFRMTAALLFLVFCLGSSVCLGMSRAPQTKDIDTSKALATINADTHSAGTKHAVETPPINPSVTGDNNTITLTVPQMKLSTGFQTGTEMTGKNDHLENTDTSKAYTLGQKLYMLGIGLLVFVVVIGLIIYFVRRYVRAQFPAISAAIDGLIKAGDQVIAKRIAELRIKQAAATDPTVKTAIADTISDLESARGQVVAERAKMDV